MKRIIGTALVALALSGASVAQAFTLATNAEWQAMSKAEKLEYLVVYTETRSEFSMLFPNIREFAEKEGSDSAFADLLIRCRRHGAFTKERYVRLGLFPTVTADSCIAEVYGRETICGAGACKSSFDWENAPRRWRNDNFYPVAHAITKKWDEEIKLASQEEATAQSSITDRTLEEIEAETARIEAEIALLEARRQLAELETEVEVAERSTSTAQTVPEPKPAPKPDPAPKPAPTPAPAVAAERVEIPGATPEEKVANANRACVEFVKADALYGFKEGWGAEYSNPSPGVNRMTWTNAKVKNEYGTWMNAPLACDTKATADGRLFLTRLTLGGEVVYSE